MIERVGSGCRISSFFHRLAGLLPGGKTAIHVNDRFKAELLEALQTLRAAPSGLAVHHISRRFVERCNFTIEGFFQEIDVFSPAICPSAYSSGVRISSTFWRPLRRRFIDHLFGTGGIDMFTSDRGGCGGSSRLLASSAERGAW